MTTKEYKRASNNNQNCPSLTLPGKKEMLDMFIIIIIFLLGDTIDLNNMLK